MQFAIKKFLLKAVMGTGGMQKMYTIVRATFQRIIL